MDPGVSTFRPDIGAEELEAWFSRHEKLRAAPVTTPEGTLLGMVRRSRVGAVAAARTEAG